MCGTCCKEFKGWKKSFTRTELWLAVLEAALLILLIVCLIVTVLHLIACSQRGGFVTVTAAPPGGDPGGQTATAAPAALRETCSWDPAHRTEPGAVFYEQEQDEATLPPARSPNASQERLRVHAAAGPPPGDARAVALAAGCGARPLCAAVAVSARWALAAVGCVRAARGCRLAGGAVQRVERRGPAALLSAAGPLPAAAAPPAPLHRHLTVLGERLTMLTYNSYQNVSLEQAAVRSISVWVVMSAQCGRGDHFICTSTLSKCAARGGGAGADSGRAGGALLRGRRLLGLTARAPRCGYISFDNLLTVVDWIRDIVDKDT